MIFFILFLWLFYYYLPLFWRSFNGFVFACTRKKWRMEYGDSTRYYKKKNEDSKEEMQRIKDDREKKDIIESLFCYIGAIGAVYAGIHTCEHMCDAAVQRKTLASEKSFSISSQHAWTWHQGKVNKIITNDRFWPIFRVFCCCCYLSVFHLVDTINL